MKAIYKYPIARGPGEFNITIPIDAEIVSCESQKGDIFLWAIVEISTAQNVSNRKVRIVGTGHNFPFNHKTDQWKFFRTIVVEDWVWHVFLETTEANVRELSKQGT